MPWRYIAARERCADEDVWTVRELYEDDGKLGWSADPIAPQGATWFELFDDLSRMGAIASAQFLDLSADPPGLAMRPRPGRRRR